jgi:hypothetical protein
VDHKFGITVFYELKLEKPPARHFRCNKLEYYAADNKEKNAESCVYNLSVVEIKQGNNFQNGNYKSADAGSQ